MKKALIIAVVAIATLFVSSCATVSTIAVTNSAALSQANFQIVKPVSTTIDCTRILGFFGGAAKKVALENAIADMSKNLGPNQALAYINVVDSNKIPIIPIIITETCTINAMVVEFK